MIINEKMLNLQKKDYEATPLFLGEEPGLADTINVSYPKLEELYFKLVAQDWKRVGEFPFASCRHQVETGGFYTDMLVETIAFQWAADSMAGRRLLPLISPFVSNNSYWELYSRIAENENIHAGTYSEIVKAAFENPNEVITRILGITQSMERVASVSAIMQNTYVVGLKLQLGEITRESDEAYDAIFMFHVALLLLENVQFRISFLTTFALAKASWFVPIALAVQKICGDELDIHVKAGMAVLDIELMTDRGLMAFNRNRDKILELFNEVMAAEVRNTEFVFRDGREIEGVLNKQQALGYVWRTGAETAKFLGLPKIENEYTQLPELAFMNDWTKLDSMQGSPMEMRDGKYLNGAVVRDDEGVEFDIEGLL